MASKREQILEQIKSLLLPTAGVSGRVYRSRTEAIDRAQSPCINIKPKSEIEPKENNISVLDHELTVAIEVVARGSEPDSLVDPVIVDAHGRLMADVTLGGLAVDIYPGATTYEMEAADQPVCVLTAEYTIRYRTGYTDLTA